VVEGRRSHSQGAREAKGRCREDCKDVEANTRRNGSQGTYHRCFSQYAVMITIAPFHPVMVIDLSRRVSINNPERRYPAGERIQRDGSWCVYEFAVQLEHFPTGMNRWGSQNGASRVQAACWRRRLACMAKALSNLRQRVIAAIDGGLSCRQAAEHFGVRAASAIRWRGRLAPPAAATSPNRS
jgi:hypothetical protein